MWSACHCDLPVLCVSALWERQSLFAVIFTPYLCLVQPKPFSLRYRFHTHPLDKCRHSFHYVP